MSLYRKYRPRSFSDVTGQDHVVTTLTNAVTQDKLAHAYLFAGSRGTGKTSVARILAKSMLTKGMTDETLKRQIIQAVDDGSLVDLVEIDAASNRGIDDIRTLVEKIQFSPVAASAKVYIIDEVHMLTREAFNALLKTLEEPPSYAYFILATTELQKIPATIQSRCQRFTFRQIGTEDIVKRLEYVAKSESLQADGEALELIALHAAGGMRDALSLLDQLRALSRVTVQDVRMRIGESGQEFVESIFTAMESGDSKAILETVARLEQAGVPLDVFCRQLLAESRNRMHQAVDEGKDHRPYAATLTVLLTAIRDLRQAPVPGLVLESALLSLIHGATEAEPEKPRMRLFSRKKEDPLPPAPSSSVAPAPPLPPASKEKPLASALVEAPAMNLDEIRKAWPEIVNAVSPASVKMSLKNGRVHAMRGATLILAFPSAFHRDKVSATDASRNVEEVIEKTFKKPIRIECVLEEERRSSAQPKGDMVNLAEAAADVF